MRKSKTASPASAGEALLEKLLAGWLDAAAVLADWLEDRGDPRGARLRREWQRTLKGCRLSWLRDLYCVDRRRWVALTADQRRMAQSLSLHDYACRLLSVPPDAPLPRSVAWSPEFRLLVEGAAGEA